MEYEEDQIFLKFEHDGKPIFISKPFPPFEIWIGDSVYCSPNLIGLKHLGDIHKKLSEIISEKKLDI